MLPAFASLSWYHSLLTHVMESTTQQSGNSTQPPIIQETTQTFTQTPFLTQFTQKYVPPILFNQVSPSVLVQASMTFTGQVQASSTVSLQNTHYRN